MSFNKVSQSNLEMVRLLTSFKARGLRLTGPRRAIFECLAGSQDWVTPARIYEQAKRISPSLGLVTVYRTLNSLHQQGLVRRIHLSDGCHGYMLAGLAHGHYLVCQECQQVIEFSECDLAPLETHITGATGFKIQGHVLQLVGLCPSCQARPTE